jgi:tRNA A37 threonylcarbamoyladenosine dehydratase
MNANSQSFQLDRRFDRMGRLVGEPAMQRLARAHVMILGLGGVGSWAAECLARSGLGALTIVDFDDICITNFNRQLHALDGFVGQPKAGVMAARLRSVNPAADIRVMPRFYNKDSSAEILSVRPDYVIDAIDCVTAKAHLLATCRAQGIPVVTSTGSGGRLDPTRVEVKDLSQTDVDPLAKMVRKLLRRDYDFPSEDEGHFGITAVFSKEQPSLPHELVYDGGKGFRCMCAKQTDVPFTCDKKNVIMGTAPFVTGAFGLHCASVAIRALMQEEAVKP